MIVSAKKLTLVSNQKSIKDRDESTSSDFYRPNGELIKINASHYQAAAAAMIMTNLSPQKTESSVIPFNLKKDNLAL